MSNTQEHMLRSFFRLNAGFSLVEVLVTLLVLAIGLLGLAGLQNVGLRNNQSAYQRSQATILAADMADRMRANQVGVNMNLYDQPASANHNCTGAIANCTPQQLAQTDNFEWNAIIADQLPEGAGVVCVDSTPNDGTAGAPACDGGGNLFAIKIFWVDRNDPNAAAKRFVTVFQP